MLGTKKQIYRVRIASEELDRMSKEDLVKSWNLQEEYVDYIEAKLNENPDHSELANLRESEEKLKQQQLEALRKENILVMRLTTKEQEMQEYAAQIQELKQAQVPNIAHLRSALLDPAVNLMFDRMRREIETLKARLEETQNELNAWKFTPDSVTGKRLMAKCRLLYQENEDLGKMISSGRIAKLEGDLALQKTFTEELKKSQTELDDLLLELDEDLEGLQGTVCYLQQQLREAKELIQKLQKKGSDLPKTSNSSEINHNCLSNEPLNAKEKSLPVPPCNTLTNNSSEVLPSEPRSTFDSSPPKVPLESNSKLASEPSSNHSCLSQTLANDNDNEPQISSINIKTELPENETNVEVDKDPIPPQHSPLLKTIKQEPSSLREEPPVESVSSQQITIPVRGSLHMEEYDSEQETEPPKTAEDNSLPNNVSTINVSDEHLPTPKVTPPNPPEQPQQIVDKRTPQNCNTSGSSKGRKRTRGPKLHVAEDTSVCETRPKIKRLRRRNIVVEQDIVEPEHRTHLEIDGIDNTDAEVEVAQALVNMSTAKKERKDVQVKSQDLITESLGNGEILKKKNDVEND